MATPYDGRRGYHHGALRQAIIDASIEMIAEGGERAVNLREAARRAGVSSGAPFRHFRDKSALLLAVADEAARRLTAAMESAGALEPPDDPLARFRGMGIAYVVWAEEHPELYRMLHRPERFGEARSPALAAMAEAQREAIGRLLRSARAGGHATDEESLVILTAHALVLGLARLLVDGAVVEPGRAGLHARELATAVTGLLGRGIAQQPSHGRAPQKTKPQPPKKKSKAQKC